MTDLISPAEARDRAAEFLRIIAPMAPCVIRGADLRAHIAATARAQALCELPPTASTCWRLSECLGILLNLWLDAPLFRAKPRAQAKAVLDCFEIAGSACHTASFAGYFDAPSE